MISSLILTHNEEDNLPRCLAALAWCDDIVIFDSWSTDRTVEIAEQAGARVFKRRFDNERDHRTASLQVPFRHAWIYNPDADEVATPELIAEMHAAVADSRRLETAYRMRFKNMFMGRWIKRSSLYPTWVVRLMRPTHVRFERDINLRYIVDGSEGRLNAHFHHFSFHKGLSAWFDKHNRYSDKEALETLKAVNSGRMLNWSGLLAADPIVRRATLKELSFHLPFRPLLRFVYMFILKRGFLDGIAGYHYCRLLSIYEYMIALKVKEAAARSKAWG